MPPRYFQIRSLDFRQDPWLAVFGAEDEMVMQRSAGIGHGKEFGAIRWKRGTMRNAAVATRRGRPPVCHPSRPKKGRATGNCRSAAVVFVWRRRYGQSLP